MAAGTNIRRLAAKRRFRAIQCFSVAALLACLDFQGEALLSLLATSTHTEAIPFPWWAQQLWLLIAMAVAGAGGCHWQHAAHAAQGAKGETEIETLLNPLKSEGWQSQYGLRESRVGDIDVSLISPAGNGFTIDVKSHGGQVRVRDRQLYRQYGKQSYPFEKDFLEQAKRQAMVLQDLKRLRLVVPIIVFSKATVAIKQPVAGVHVCSKNTLVALLRQLSR